MILKPNYNNDTEYRFVLNYNDSKDNRRIVLSYVLSFDTFLHKTRCNITNIEVLNKVIEAILNRKEIHIIKENVVLENVEEVIIDNMNDIKIYDSVENFYLRFKLIDVGEYWNITNVFLDNRVLSVDEYKTIYDCTGDIENYCTFCTLLSNDKTLYIPKTFKLYFNEFLDLNDLLVEDNNMIKLQFNVRDIGTAYEVIGVNENETAILGSINSVYVVHSYAIYEFIISAINEGKTIYLPKNNYSQLTVDDIVIVEQESELETQKKIAINKVKDFLYSTRINKLQLLDYYTFTILNNYFINMGFVITYQNREEKYLEIITAISEMEDENESEIAIVNLENYLNILDKLKELEGFVVRLNTTIDEIISCETVEAVETVVNDFLDFFK